MQLVKVRISHAYFCSIKITSFFSNRALEIHSFKSKVRRRPASIPLIYRQMLQGTSTKPLQLTKIFPTIKRKRSKIHDSIINFLLTIPCFCILLSLPTVRQAYCDQWLVIECNSYVSKSDLSKNILYCHSQYHGFENLHSQDILLLSLPHHLPSLFSAILFLIKKKQCYSIANFLLSIFIQNGIAD